MRITVLSRDEDLIQTVLEMHLKSISTIDLFNESNNPLDVLAHVFTIQPNILVVDDDFTKPETVDILKAIKKVFSDISIVFITPSSSLELGREISQVGIHFYMLKPINQMMLKESLTHIAKRRVESRF